MISKFNGYLNTLINFINNNCIPDVILLSNVYTDYHSIGKAPGNLIAYGVFPTPRPASDSPKRRAARWATG